MNLLLLLAPEDNCLVACADLAVHQPVQLDGHALSLPQAVPMGYKIARHGLSTGNKVVRHGAVIGSATQPIAVGELIHTHNLRSDYLPTRDQASTREQAA
jgi:altronate dehydratase small subunit